MILSANGHEVIRAGNGKEALELLRDTTPDLLILDVDMPYLNGLEIVVTGKARQKARGRAYHPAYRPGSRGGAAARGRGGR